MGTAVKRRPERTKGVRDSDDFSGWCGQNVLNREKAECQGKPVKS